MTSGDGVAVFWEQVVGWGGIPCTARQGAPSARSTSYQQKSATASHRSANSGLWAAHWGVSAPPNMMASEPPTRATCAPAWWAATRPLGRAGCGGVLASGPQQGRSSPSTDCCFSETRLGVPKCPPKHVAHLIKSNTPGAAFDHGNRDAVPAKPAHGADRRPASVARARHGVGRRARHSSRLHHARPRASHEPNAASEAQQRGQLRKPRREGKAGSRQPCHSGRGRAGRVRATRRRFGRIARAPPPRLAAGERVGVEMLG